jgi:hypothetical protein
MGALGEVKVREDRKLLKKFKELQKNLKKEGDKPIVGGSGITLKHFPRDGTAVDAT